MSRIHLFEWEDQKWFPSLFRNLITDGLVLTTSKLYIPVSPKLTNAMRSTGYKSIVDLCSGGGGPSLIMVQKCSETLNEPVTATLTDLYPNIEMLQKIESQSKGAIRYLEESTNAMDCPKSLEGFRTIFTGLHHFRPEDAKKILADAVDKEVPIAAFEFTERSFFNLTVVPLFTILLALVIIPFAGRMTISRFFFTYILPLAPLFIAWDGFVSSLRTYSPKELQDLTENLGYNGYQWEIGKIPANAPFGLCNITYIIGLPSDRG